MNSDTHYQTLGVTSTASADDIVKAYRRLAMRWHPDRNPANPHDAKTRFQQIKSAYDVLSDPGKRELYDLQISARRSSSSDSASPGSSFDEAVRARWNKRRGPPPVQGADIECKMTVPLETVIFGGVVDVTMLAPRLCGTCDGNGKLSGHFACPSCGGDGKNDRGRNCRKCSGYGAVEETRCPNCSGKGVVKTEKTIRVTVPPGVVEGTVLRVKGAGGPGLNGGAPGSAFCRIKIQAHRTYTLHGLTLTRDLTVDFVTAMLGGAVPVELFGVQVKVAVPPMTRAGKIITMEKAGLKNSRTGENGDLKFRVVIDLPASAHQLRSEHKEILRAMFNAAAAK